MLLLRFNKSINQSLIRTFDHSRIRYVILVFPVYQALAFIGIATIIHLVTAIEAELYSSLLVIVLMTIIGIPISASWYLSCLLFGACFFGVLAWLGIPIAPWVTKQLEGVVNRFR